MVDEVRVHRLLRRITDDLAVGPPSDNGDAVNLLGKHGVLSPELASSLRKAVGSALTGRHPAAVSKS